MRVLIAPQEFKGSLTAGEAAAAIASGLRRARPRWQVDALPLSDGGPGFVDVLHEALGGTVRTVPARDALGRTVQARLLIDAAGNTAYVEAAQANGIGLLAPDELDPLAADTAGVGEILLAAAGHSPSRIIVGVGGSATTDGGAGMARALGARLVDEAGRPLAPGGGALSGLARIDWRRPAEFANIRVSVATDVTNPLLGPEGAAAVYGPQKGASAADVSALEAALTRYAAVVRRALGVDIAMLQGGGAAGGLAAGLVAFLGAGITSGFEIVAGATSLERRIENADIVVTGEGSFDAQSGRGKTAWRVRELARAAGKPAIVFCGVADRVEEEVHAIAELQPDRPRAMADATALLEELAARWAGADGQ